MPLSAPDARTRINEWVTVEMTVKAAKNCQRCSLMFLDSEEDHHDPKNFAVAVTDTGKARFREAKIDNSECHFEGKTIRVTGKVIVKDSQPQIEVDDPQQIETVQWGRSHGGSRHPTTGSRQRSLLAWRRKYSSSCRRACIFLKRRRTNGITASRCPLLIGFIRQAKKGSAPP